MEQPFNAGEIFEIAEQIERNGARFYRKAAEAATDAEARKLLNDLAAMEDGHEKTFAQMHQDLCRERSGWCPELLDPDSTDQGVLYLRAIAEGRVFDIKSDPSELLTGDESLAHILRTAIGLEKDSIVFYLGIKDAVPENLGRDKMDGLIREEMSHVTLLTKALVDLGP